MWKHRVNQKQIDSDLVYLSATQDKQGCYLSIALKPCCEAGMISAIALHYPMSLEKALNIVDNATESTFERAALRLKQELKEVIHGK